MAGNLKYYIFLNLTVLVWGFTGVLGDKISLPAEQITFFRIGIALISLILIGSFYKTGKKITSKQVFLLILTGFIVGLHWFAFFLSIKLSTVSVGVVCMSSSTLFTAILEPIIFKRKYLTSEFVLSIFIVFGVILIIGFEPHYILGIAIGLCSAFLASLFNVLNGKYIKTIPSLQITTLEMLGGFIIMFIVLAFNGSITPTLFNISSLDWIYLIVLGLICTTIAFLVSVWIMKFLSPFTVSLSINLEPVYAILIVLIISYFEGKTTEQMSVGFYFGTAVILVSIFINAFIKRKKSTQ